MIPAEDITALLPHRPPMLMVDRVLELDGAGARAVKQISWSEPCFQGHFPGQPIFPGVLVIEALAQTCAIWLNRGGNEGLPIFAGIDKARFRRRVQPGESLELAVRFLSERKGFYTFQAEASVEGQCACQAELVVCCKEKPKGDWRKDNGTA